MATVSMNRAQIYTRFKATDRPSRSRTFEAAMPLVGGNKFRPSHVSIKPSPWITEFFDRSSYAPEKFDRSLFNTDLLAILDAEGIDKTAIICPSMGGWTALRTAVHHPDRGSYLILSNIPGGIKIPTLAAALAESGPAFAERGVGIAADTDSFAQENLEAAFLYRQIGSLNINLPEDLSGRNPAEISPDEMEGYCVPTLMITSEYDQQFTPNLIREVSEHIPESKVIEMTTAGHSPYFETPDVFNATVLAFPSKNI